MKLEKEIHQVTKFTSEYHKLSVNIMYTASWLATIHTRYLKPFDVTSQQFNILRILRGNLPDPSTINMLIERMIDKSSNASRLVDRLSEKGFVERCTRENDKRSVNVMITEKGLKVLSELDVVMKGFEEVLKNISTAEAGQLNVLLDKLRG